MVRESLQLRVGYMRQTTKLSPSLRFSDHLEDTAADWLENAALVKSIAAAGVAVA